ncbi:MAG: antibiotic biosynthesis monooxygenase [Anaerolineae bacterium]|nr:antibiotic biosynthesis monooxygenase [Anaerolineae bacterium]
MYGTVAHMHIKPGAQDQLQQVAREISIGRAPGQMGVYIYQMDRDSDEYYLAVIFESKEAYLANAQSPEQHERFMKLMQVLAVEPEWNDGEIVYTAL